MTTSGTVATTVINTASLIEKAVRRIGKTPSILTPELLSVAQDDLYLILLSLANEGLNLWCIETDYIGITQGQATYVTPAGTIDVLNLLYSQPSRVTGTDSSGATSYITDLGQATFVSRVGVMFSAVTVSDTITISYSSDGVVWYPSTTLTSTNLTANAWYWINLPTAQTKQYWRASTGSASTVSTFYIATNVFDIPIIQFNRDDYFGLPNKSMQARPCVNYYLEKLLTPQVTLWPVPNNGYDHLTLTRQRQIQDVGLLTQTIEVPNRRLESTIWELAERLAFDLPDVDPGRRQEAVQMNAKYKEVADIGETDGANLRLQPRIAGYTR